MRNQNFFEEFSSIERLSLLNNLRFFLHVITVKPVLVHFEDEKNICSYTGLHLCSYERFMKISKSLLYLDLKYLGS